MSKRTASWLAAVGLVALIAGLAVAAAGCLRSIEQTQPPQPPAGSGTGAGIPAYQQEFLAKYSLRVEGPAETFQVRVPTSWTVPLGAYPEGLYWTLANVFSQDAGLDLTGLRGHTVDVHRYRLSEGLPGEGGNATYKYPSNLVLLAQNDRVVGAWLEFNVAWIGPSVKVRSLEDITGLAFEQWVEREGLFVNDVRNADLAELEPAEVIRDFFEAINAGDRERANACLSPREMLNALSVNRVPYALYNPGFDNNNSLVANIVRGRLLSSKPYDPGEWAPGAGAADGKPEMVHLAAELELKWCDGVFNTPDGKATRFFALSRTKLGWKIEGMGTGP